MPINDGSIIVGIKGDTSDIERKISELQRKLRSLREGGALGQLAQQYRSRGMEDRANQLDQFRQREQVRNRRELEQSFRNQEKSLDSLKRHYDNIQKGLDSMVKGTDAWKQKSTEAAEVWDKIVGKAAQVKATYQELFQGNGAGLPGLPMQFQQGFGPFSARDLTHIARSGQMGGFGGAMKGVGRVMTPAMMAQLGAGTLGAVGSVGQFYKQIATYPERLTQREANTAGMLGELSRLQMNRRSYEFSLYGPERLKALETAQTRVGAEKVGDVTSILGRTAGGAVTGAALGFGIPGAIIGAGIGLGTAMFDDRKRSMVTDKVGLTEGAYDREMQSVFAGTYQSDLAARKAKNIDLTNSLEFFKKNAERFKGLQRQFGLSDQELYAGPESIFQRAGRAGYDMDVMTQNMQGIMGAGGTTAVGRAGALTAAKFARNLNVTNAAQVMGKLSGGYGMDEIRSKDEMIRMYAEATRIGLDESEVRNYMEAAADIGFRTGGDQGVIQGALTAGLQSGGVFSGRGISAAKSAFQRLRDETGTREGLTGQFKLASLSEMGFNLEESAYISGLPLDQLSENDPVLKGILEDLNKREKEKFIKGGGKAEDYKEQEITPEKLREKVLESTFRNKGTIEAMKKFRTARGKLGDKFDFSQENLDKIMGGEAKTKEEIDQKKKVAAYLESQKQFGKKLALERGLPEELLERLGYYGVKSTTDRKVTPEQEAAARKGLDEESLKAVDKQLRSFARMDLGNLKLLSDAAKDGTTNLEKLTKSFDEVTTSTSAFARRMHLMAQELEKITSEDIKAKVIDELKRNIGNVTVGRTQERGDYVTINSEDEFFTKLYGAPGGGSK